MFFVDAGYNGLKYFFWVNCFSLDIILCKGVNKRKRSSASSRYKQMWRGFKHLVSAKWARGFWLHLILCSGWLAFTFY